MIESEVLNLLLQLGSAGAVIAVVIIFIKAMDKRDVEYRNFFIELNKANASDMKTLTDAMTSLTSSVRDIADKLAEHDKRVEERIDSAIISVGSTPRRTRQTKS